MEAIEFDPKFFLNPPKAEVQPAPVHTSKPKDSVEAWQRWKSAPTPDSLNEVVQSVRPAIDGYLSANFSGSEQPIMRGEAKRLAINAIKTYSPDAGASLSTHVSNHLKALQREQRKSQQLVNVSREMDEHVRQYIQTQKDFFEEFNREPTDDEIADRLKISRQKLHKIQSAHTMELAESQVEYTPDQEDDTVAMWTDFVYHDLDPQGKLIMDYSLGRGGKPQLNQIQIAQKLNLNPTIVNRRVRDISKKILDGVGATRS